MHFSGFLHIKPKMDFGHTNTSDVIFEPIPTMYLSTTVLNDTWCSVLLIVKIYSSAPLNNITV